MRNVADLADPPAAGRSEQAMSVWTSDELRCFLEAISGHDLYPLYLLAATTGMRRGELAGLTWRNVDLDAARLTVNQQILSVGYNLIEGSLKSATSRRTIDLDPLPVAELRRHRRNQLERHMATGRQQRRRIRVRQAPTARPSTRTTSARPSGAPVAKLDVPRIRLHDLRHTPRQHPAAARSQRQGGQRTPRPQQRRVHHDRLPARHARHASPSRSNLRRRRLR